MRLWHVISAALLAFCIAQTGTSATAATEWYGSGIASDTLNNIPIGKYHVKASYRFRAKHTGLLQAIRPYIIYNFSRPKYHLGTGGTLKITLQTNQTGDIPSGQILASYIHSNPLQKGKFPLMTFTSPARVEKGRLYHMVFENIDPSPEQNFVSIDDLYMYARPTPAQPTISDLDLATLKWEPSKGWYIHRGHTPILAITYSDGTTQGLGYMEVWRRVEVEVTGTTAVRETFQVSGKSRSVTGVWLRVRRYSGTAPLGVTLEKGDGTLIEQGQIPSSSIELFDNIDHRGGTWVKYTFNTTRVLESGQRYNLLLTAPSGTVYAVYPLRDGSLEYSFPKNTVFSDGYAQWNKGSGWVGWTQWGIINREDGDLQFYFDVTPSGPPAPEPAPACPSPAS